MYKFKSVITLLALVLCCATTVLAAEENDDNTVLITMTNATSETIHFERVMNANPGNEFTVAPETVAPSKACVITAKKTKHNDVFGQVIFTNSLNQSFSLVVLDQEQVHFGQPIFNVSTPPFTSTLLSKTRNKHVGPRLLTYTAANIQVNIK